MSDSDKREAQLRQLVASLGGYRAEQLEEEGRLYQLFSAPAFMAELETNRCCLLVGGRGTGKTTLLKGLSLEGQQHISAPKDRDLAFVGVYLRLNSNRVAAFSGPELSQDRWNRVFGHYLNLVLCDELLRTVLNLPVANSPPAMTQQGLMLVSRSLHLEPCQSLIALRSEIRNALVTLEAAINNIGDGPELQLSLQGRPIDLLIEHLTQGPILQKRLVFFLVDEYENLSEYQQTVFNTLIKHAGPSYSFKIGVKALGLKTRSTLVESETLSSPADYEQIDIVGRLKAESFSEFATSVVQLRLDGLSKISGEDFGTVPPPAEWLRSLSFEQEAMILGIEVHLATLDSILASELDHMEQRLFRQLGPLDQYAVLYLEAADPVAGARTAMEDLTAWRKRVDNYRYAMLYSIRRRRVGPRKYYAGWKTLCALADGNTRYLLQIVNEIALAQMREGHSLADEVAPEVQTKSAEEIGYRNLTDLEGIAREGSSLVRLILGLGRVFNVMAARPEGHAPEVNQFALSQSTNEKAIARASDLLDTGVQHQALIDFAANKLARESGETRSSNYMLHPIYSAFFVYSHRKQRKLRLSPEELNGLVEQPAHTIRTLLAKTGRDHFLDTDEVDNQLSLFSSFYEQTYTA